MSSAVWSNLKDKFRTGERCVESSCHGRSGDRGPDDEVEPPDRAELGRAAWRYLHTLAAHHPEQPTALEEADSQAWLASFISFYPCSHCAAGFIDIVEAMPPRTSSRRDYAVWWCEAHNKVNAELSAELQRCEPSRLLGAGMRSGLGLDEIAALSSE
ncbi:unnamed protein product [Polarella glacialis]|uniref:Sulfhydryl oxidase n=1 Tax=Polarella glacialis TaxID=89957 RepID=A0A813JYA3_POLGL|nr:unnamed protein product [Polarella glacialis]CAE8692421.1 unnamed protein product [Polarella glacialis]|mmetsp:Transcript_52640/g.85321  ORF Transcript_52640/g.85321 Transcript_52640/m.85321 type:complete len:157 (+) Transcript_52640:43-513(+)